MIIEHYLVTGHFFTDEALAAIAPDFAAKAALRVVFFGFELRSKPKNTLFSSGLVAQQPLQLRATLENENTL
ncbi:MAG: hypothetical protein JXA33_05635 [Anaerolineae bacterium]|nr:hypothetical protein [Anaerolineae bacterium]